MRRALPFLLALALAPVGTPSPLAPAPAGEPPLFLCTTPDGGQTLLLWLEDDCGPGYVHRPLAQPPQGPVQEVGLYEHAWTWNGLPETTLGAYAITTSQQVLRVPVVVLENAPSQQAVVAAAQEAVLGYVAGEAASLVPFLLEIAEPDLGDPSEAGLGFQNFQSRPPIVLWQARRALPGADAWLGTYLAREGSVVDTPGGREGVRSVEVGSIARMEGGDQRLAGVFVEQRAVSRAADEGRVLSTAVTAGAVAPTGRVPLVTVVGEDARSGAGVRPDEQSSTVTVGVEAPQGFVPLAGVRTDVTNRVHAAGIEVTRTTALGVFALGAWTPLAGVQYHADRTPLLSLPTALVAGGLLGSNASGDAELSLGVFVDGAYRPAVQATLDDAFAGARYVHRTMVGLGVFTPLGYQPLASVTYDGTESLVGWASRVLEGQEKGAAWIVSAGPWVGQLYVPVVGLRFRGDAPGADQPHEAEVAAGTFVVGYTAFVPLVAVGASSTPPLANAITSLATQGPGNSAGPWQVGVGSYPIENEYVPLVQVSYQPVADPEAPASSDLVVSVGGLPVLGVQYRGEAPLLQSWGSPGSLGDDGRWCAAVGVYAPAFTPLVRACHDGQGTTAILGPDL